MYSEIGAQGDTLRFDGSGEQSSAVSCNMDRTGGTRRMVSRFRRSSVASVFLAMFVLSFGALGCTCVTPSPCEAIGQSQLVFLGTVTEISASSGQFKTARMRVDRVFKGDLSPTIELYDDGMCDGPDLQLGRQYLMYTSGDPNRSVPARGCTRSRGVEDAEADLSFLEKYRAGKVTTHIDGTVRFRPDEPMDSDERRTPLQNVRVTLSGDGREFHAMTDSVGRYTFSNVAPGEYTVDAELPGYRTNWVPDQVTLAEKGCAEADILMKVDRRVQGVVRDASGTPVGGARVEMSSTNAQLKLWEQPILLDVSDENGHYTIDGVPPGEYLLGVNIKSSPTKEYPYTPTYYPNTPDVGKAIPIRVADRVSTQDFDLRVPPQLSLVTIKGRVQTKDGKPPPAQDHPQVRIKEPGLRGQIEQEEIKIDVEGRFQFELCEGIPYSAFAFSGPPVPVAYSAPVEFTPTKENDQLVLTLDKTPEEFLKLRRQ